MNQVLTDKQTFFENQHVYIALLLFLLFFFFFLPMLQVLCLSQNFLRVYEFYLCIKYVTRKFIIIRNSKVFPLLSNILA